ncbi:MAG: hypothetical protein Q9228_006940 [Teloschistes exilis]
MQFIPSLVMPDEVLESLALWAGEITAEETLAKWTGGGWSDLPEYSAEIFDIIKRGQDIPLGEGEMFEVWKIHHDIKRKRVPAPIINSRLLEFQTRREGWLIGQGERKAKRKRKEKNEETQTGKRNTERAENTPESDFPASPAIPVSTDTENSFGTPIGTATPESSDTEQQPRKRARKERPVPTQATPERTVVLLPSSTGRERRLPKRFCN